MEKSFAVFGTITTSYWSRGYGQKNPIDEYKRESFSLFQNLLEKIKENIIIFLSTSK